MTDMDMPLPEPAHTQVETYSGIALNKVVETPLFTADQLRAYGDAVRAEERERAAQICDGFASCEGIAQQCAQAIRNVRIEPQP